MEILKKIIIVSIALMTLSSCIGTKMLKFEGKTKSEMLNKFGYPNEIISQNNGIDIYVYFYEDYSVNNYPSVIGLMYINSNDEIIRVKKESTRLTLKQYLYSNNLN